MRRFSNGLMFSGLPYASAGETTSSSPDRPTTTSRAGDSSPRAAGARTHRWKT